SAPLPLWTGMPPPVVTATMAAELRATEADGGREAWSAFAARWGHRGEYESDPAVPRGEERLLGRLDRPEGDASKRPLSLPSSEPRPLLPDPLATLPRPLRGLPMLAPRHARAHREWFKDGAMRM